MKKCVVTLGIILSIWQCHLASAQSGPAQDINDPNGGQKIKRPNVLLIGIDTFRADHVSCLGYGRKTTPAIDRLAAEGVKFTSAFATSSWTTPTVMSVLTSLYPGVHQTTDSSKQLPPEVQTLATILKSNGYATAGFVSNPCIENRYGHSRGFDLYDDYSVGLDQGANVFGNNDQVSYSAPTSETVNRIALKWLETNHEKPFFMFVFYIDPHYDYVPPPPYNMAFDPNYSGTIDGRGIASEPRTSVRPGQRDLEHIIALYDGDILYTDSYVGKLLDKFREYHLLDNTLVVVFGDHGDEFYEHGSTAHAHTLYNELVHIPIIMRLPPAMPANKQIDALVSQVDIMPTILDYLGIKNTGIMQGLSLRPVIEGKQKKLHDAVYAEVSAYKDKTYASVVTENMKFIYDLNSSRNRQLFDLAIDKNEKVNLYNRLADAAQVPLESQLSAWLSNNQEVGQSLRRGQKAIARPPDDQHLEQLKGLGYVQ